jgi:DNA-binding beta-propeller fold protein YncE
MDRKTGKIVGSLVVLCCALASCIKDKPAPNAPFTIADTGSVFIICEGTFPSGYGSLFSYNPKNKTLAGDLYSNINGQPLGYVFQSMTKIDNHFFLAINNSNKVVVLDATSYKQIAVINIPQPRYIVSATAGKAYVSTMWSNKVYIISTAGFTVLGTVALPYQNPEGMIVFGNNAIVCPWDTTCSNICCINTQTDSIARTIKIGGVAPQEVQLDKDGNLWCISGDQPYGKTAALTKIDTLTGEILYSWQFGKEVSPMRLTFNPTKDTLYFIEANEYGGNTNNGIYKMGIYETALPAFPFINAGNNAYFYALGIDKHNTIYVGNPLNWEEKGWVFVYNTSGIATDSFKAGIGPGHFFFAD